ncbi:MAG: Gfo/Idh/MocA family oxidoreductase [Tannerellaceae bacterium]|jgi:predicted dehydrogenase|nr:Gfo/Idh/MocA family oxidoreductase [Tannerellaceae bacterium]
MTLSRRSFLIKSSCAVAAGVTIPGFLKASGSPSSISANDRINVALIGCRNMGWNNLVDFLPHKDVQCLALCDIDENILSKRAKDLSDKQQTGFDLYADYRKILDRKDIDAVIIGTPDHWHCLQFVDACKAGKDIYVEKPIGNSIAECDVMVAATAEYNRIVQVGQQQRSGQHWNEMISYLQTGALGTIGHVHVWANFDYGALMNKVKDSAPPTGVDYTMWLGPAPERPFNNQRFHGSWRMFWNYGGGLMTDWGVHLLDMALWGMNVKTLPQKIQATGGKFLYPQGSHETFDTQSVAYKFENHILTWEHNTNSDLTYMGKNYGLRFIGSNGMLVADREDWKVFPLKQTEPEKTVIADHQDHRTHVRNFLDCIKTRNRQTACTIENGSLCAKYAHLGNIAARVDESLVYDDTKKTFNLKKADQYLKPIYRKPWTILY